jgi:uncharacterized protein YcfL
MKDRIFLENWTFYISVNNEDIDFKFVHDTYGDTRASLKICDLQQLKVKVTVRIYWFNKVSLYLKNWDKENYQFFSEDTSYDTLSDETIKTGANREMTSRKICQDLNFNM